MAEPNSIEAEAVEKSVELEPMGPALPPTIAAPSESNELGPEVDSKLDVDDFKEDSWLVVALGRRQLSSQDGAPVRAD